MRVLLVSPVGEHGGAEQVFLALGEHLPGLGVDPVLALMRPGPLAELAAARGMKVHVFRDHRYRELHNVLRGIRWLQRLAARERVDVVHSNLTAHLYGGPAARRTGCPEVWHIHDYPHRRSLLEQLLLRMPTDFALFTTNRVAEGFPRLLRGPHAVVYPICTEPRARESAATPAEIRSRYGLAEGPLLLTVGRLQEHKGHRHLIEAVPEVLRHVPDAIFVIAGKASDRAQEQYAMQLEAMCAGLGVDANVRFVGYVPGEDLEALYQEASALIHPAVTEGFGLTLLEAMSHGVPVVAAAADGPRELIRPGENGLLAPPGDHERLAESIIDVLSSPDLAATLARNGEQLAGALSPEEMARKTLVVYERAVCSSAPHVVSR
jgi:glycosyltransferase involved in cell wall biosynthesis